jgi:hypothetical protein
MMIAQADFHGIAILLRPKGQATTIFINQGDEQILLALTFSALTYNKKCLRLTAGNRYSKNAK